MSSAQPFSIKVDDKEIEDLKHRLSQSRFPDQINDANWSYGTELGYLKELADYWTDEFDWKKQEQAINRFDELTTQKTNIK